MQAYSLDLRERVVAAYEKGEGSIAIIAARFSVGQTFLKKMLRQKRETGSLKRLPPRAGAKRVLSKSEVRWLAQRIKQQPDATLAELQAGLSDERRREVSTTTLCRELKRLRLGRKKIADRRQEKQSEAGVVLAARQHTGARAVQIH